jgi:hypothetical protein
MHGTMMAVGLVFWPAAFLTLYNNVFVKPAAETFSEVTTGWIAAQGFPVY